MAFDDSVRGELSFFRLRMFVGGHYCCFFDAGGRRGRGAGGSLLCLCVRWLSSAAGGGVCFYYVDTTQPASSKRPSDGEIGAPTNLSTAAAGVGRGHFTYRGGAERGVGAAPTGGGGHEIKL